jgi:flagellar biosynthesis/type III secretory pathway ATPase
MTSLSRVMPMVTSQEHVRNAASLRELISAYTEVEDLVSVGAYKPGTRPLSDRAIDRWDRINGLLRQDKSASCKLSDSVDVLTRIIHD